jgi:hypothetical protein
MSPQTKSSQWITTKLGRSPAKADEDSTNIATANVRRIWIVKEFGRMPAIASSHRPSIATTD